MSGDHRFLDWNVMRAVVEFDLPSPSTGITSTLSFLLEWHTHLHTHLFHSLKLSHLTHRDVLQNVRVYPTDVQSLLISIACLHLPLFFYACWDLKSTGSPIWPMHVCHFLLVLHGSVTSYTIFALLIHYFWGTYSLIQLSWHHNEEKNPQIELHEKKNVSTVVWHNLWLWGAFKF